MGLKATAFVFDQQVLHQNEIVNLIHRSFFLVLVTKPTQLWFQKVVALGEVLFLIVTIQIKACLS